MPSEPYEMISLKTSGGSMRVATKRISHRSLRMVETGKVQRLRRPQSFAIDDRGTIYVATISFMDCAAYCTCGCPQNKVCEHMLAAYRSAKRTPFYGVHENGGGPVS